MFLAPRRFKPAVFFDRIIYFFEPRRGSPDAGAWTRGASRPKAYLVTEGERPRLTKGLQVHCFLNIACCGPIRHALDFLRGAWTQTIAVSPWALQRSSATAGISTGPNHTTVLGNQRCDWVRLTSQRSPNRISEPAVKPHNAESAHRGGEARNEQWSHKKTPAGSAGLRRTQRVHPLTPRLCPPRRLQERLRRRPSARSWRFALPCN